MTVVSFIDTSVLCELVGVPGKSQRAAKIQEEFRARVAAGERFVLPMTAVIETGNHIAQAAGNRRSAAEALDRVLAAAAAERPPFFANRVAWNSAFIIELCDGDSTGQSFVDLAGNGQMGGGDVAILVERAQFLRGSNYRPTDVGIWTLEAVMGAYA